jgi:hypothetical protein
MLRGCTYPSLRGSVLLNCCAGPHPNKNAPRAKGAATMVTRAMNFVDGDSVMA